MRSGLAYVTLHPRRNCIDPRPSRLGDTAVLIEGERIAWVSPAAEAHVPADAERLDASGLILAPGFIDLQINGAFGYDFTADPASLWRVGEAAGRYGVTSFLPTIVTSPPEQIAQAQRALLAGQPAAYRGQSRWGCTWKARFSIHRRKARITRPICGCPMRIRPRLVSGERRARSSPWRRSCPAALDVCAR